MANENAACETRPKLSPDFFATEIVCLLFPKGAKCEFINYESYEPHKDFEVVRKTAEALKEKIKTYMDETIEQLKDVYKTAVLVHYSFLVKKYFIREGIDMEKLLYYSVYVSLIANKLYEEGETESINTTFSILHMICNDLRVLRKGWDSLLLAANKILQSIENGRSVPPFFLDFVSLDNILVEEGDEDMVLSSSEASRYENSDDSDAPSS